LAIFSEPFHVLSSQPVWLLPLKQLSEQLFLPRLGFPQEISQHFAHDFINRAGNF
jgi:hypothetical protein